MTAPTTRARRRPAARPLPFRAELPLPGVYLAGPDSVAVELELPVLGAGRIRATLAALDATLVVEDDPAASWARVDLDAASLRTGWPPLDARIHRLGLLDEDEHAVIRFESTGLAERTPGRYAVPADLWLRGEPYGIHADVRLASADASAVRLVARLRIPRAPLGLVIDPRLDGRAFVAGPELSVLAAVAFRPTSIDSEDFA